VADSRPVNEADIRQAVRNLGLSGLPLCVHSSMRSFGHVDGGPETVVDALLAEGCTVLVPAFSEDFEILPPVDRRIERNGWNDAHDYGVPAHSASVFTPASNVINRSMGAIPRALLAEPGRVRGYHPLNSFAAAGPLARQLVVGQSPQDVYAPLREMTRHDGYVVLMGVGLDSMTALHLAETMAGRELFVRWVMGPDGAPASCRIGSCSRGFPNLDSSLHHLETRTTVGRSIWRVYPLGETVDAAATLIRQDPEITRCSRPACRLCADAIAGGPFIQQHCI
jgi:aminoglycoside N3'-acetyltransferase